MVSLTIGAAVAALIWAYLLLGRGRFWRIGRVAVRTGATMPLRRIAVIIPARNEAAVIARSIASLLEISGEFLHIFLVDDASSDGTAQIAQQAAASAGKSDSLTIVQSRPLPPGWSGKLWAMSQGVEVASRLVPDFLLLSDADI